MSRSSLQLAWDFTVASTADLTGRMVSIRDQAFAELGNASPSYHVDSITDRPDPRVLRQVDGTFDVPLFLTRGGEPGARLVLGVDGVPIRQPGTFRAAFRCAIPPKAATGPARMSLYGHGLFGDVGEVESSLTRDMAATYNIVYCATNWYGMTEADVPAAASILGDLSGFGAIPDRLHQGLLSFLFLGRLMTGADGFGSDPAFEVSGRSVLRPDELYFDGNSQGAILGGALTAVSSDVKRSVLAEAGMNYSLLLDRSVDFDDYLAIYRPAYPGRFDRLIGLQLIQLLWDRAETNGYANHITSDPLPATPAHDVLLLGAVGDHQVTEFSLRVEAATLGAAAPPRRRSGANSSARSRGRIGSPRRHPSWRIGLLPVGHGFAAVADHQHAVTVGPRPARRHPQHRRGPAVEGGVLAPGRLGDRPVCGRRRARRRSRPPTPTVEPTRGGGRISTTEPVGRARPSC